MKAAYTITSTAGMSREEWLILRKTGLGGSDAGAVCGANPYSSPMKVYFDKVTDSIEDSDSEAMRQGRDLEDYVAQRFSEATGFKVRRARRMYRSVSHPFMIADVDRMISGEDAGLECKTANAFQAEQWKDGAIPPHYLIQCLHYLAVTGKSVWYLAVVILGREFQYRKITRNEEILNRLIAVEQQFWNRYILAKKIPEPDGSPACDEVLGQVFQKAREGDEIPLIGFDGKLARREQLLKTMEELEKEQRQIEQEVKLYLRNHESAISEHYRVRWSNVDTRRLDTGRLKVEKPELYQEFLKVTSSRRLQIQAA